jgi:SAM-dependent methyltransferase
MALLCCSLAYGQTADDDTTWREFISWARTQPGAGLELAPYREKLIEGGLTAAEADAVLSLIPKLYEASPAYRLQADELVYNKLYRTPEQTRYTLEPNSFLASTIRDLKPGDALDVAMGQGRNGIYLATRGWEVTGFDIAEEGLKAANESAAKAGVRIHSVKASFDDFDYGEERWDLIYFVYTDAPIVDPEYVALIRAALKPGGLVLIDRPFRSLVNPEPWPETEQDKPNALTKAWSDLQIVFYEDTTGIGDWRQTGEERLQYKLRIVRLLARKL